jgi:hypothetical protein
MKTYKYSTKERAERVAKEIGCSGHHTHKTENGKKIFMPCKSHKIFLSKTEKKEEVTELIDFDGTMLSSAIPILNPASSVQGSTTTDKMVAMSRNPRDPLLRGWYGYYGESEMKEVDMSKAFGYEDTMFMDAEESLKYFKKKLGMDKDNAEERVDDEFGKSKKRDERSKYKNKKGFVGRPILKEKELGEEVLVNKNDDRDVSTKKQASKILIKNVKSIKKMADREGYSINDLIKLIKNE